MNERATSLLREPTRSSVERSGAPCLHDFAALAALMTCVVIFRPYTGIVGDSTLYMGGALASLDPDGIGRDPMWALDGQMRFSIFPFVSRFLVGALGAPKAAMALAAMGLLLWAAALVALARVIAPRGAVIAIVLACAAFPATYNSHATVYFGEPIATPRVFAEAAVISALASLVAGRVALTIMFAAVAVVLHPIMALAGIGSIFVFLCFVDRRWLYAGAGGLGLLLGGAALGVPFLDRLVSPIDAEWLAKLLGPDDYLFPTTWPESAWSLKAAQVCTVALGALVARGAVRRLFLAILVTSIGAMAVTIVLGDLFPVLLIVQAQPWRATWLLALAAAVAFAICGPTLWREGAQSRFILALLAVAWIAHASVVGALLALVALAMRYFRFESWRLLASNAVKWTWIGVAGLALLSVAVNISLATSFTAAAPPGVRPPPLWLMLDSHVLAVPVALLAMCVVFAPPARFPPVVVASASLAFSIVAWSFWRQEWDPYRAAIAHAGRQGELVRLVDSRPGPVLWLGGNQEAWYWAGRPNWVSGMQGMGIVFSRELTMKWFERMQVLIDLGWIADGGTISRTISRPDPPYPDLSDDKIQRFCNRPDAPAWVIAPIPAARFREGAKTWRAPAVRFATDPAGGPMLAIEHYAVLDCAARF